jgi:hypothetical protein
VVNLKGSKGRLLKADMDFNSVSPKAFFSHPQVLAQCRVFSRNLGAMLRKLMAKAHHKHDARDYHGEDDGEDQSQRGGSALVQRHSWFKPQKTPPFGGLDVSCLCDIRDGKRKEREKEKEV